MAANLISSISKPFYKNSITLKNQKYKNRPDEKSGFIRIIRLPAIALFVSCDKYRCLSKLGTIIS